MLQFSRHPTDLHEQVLQRLGMRLPKRTERRVIDRPSLGQPPKIEPHSQRLFERPTRPNPREQPIQ